MFYLDADCYLRRPTTWGTVEGDVIFGSREPPSERAPQAYPDFCRRMGMSLPQDGEYYGSCMYVKERAKASYAAALQRLLACETAFRYFDDMHYRLTAAREAGLRIGVVPKELEYKVVFNNSKSDDPEMLHLCFSLDWYLKDRCYPWFLKIIDEFLQEHPGLGRYLPRRWVEDARQVFTAPGVNRGKALRPEVVSPGARSEELGNEQSGPPTPPPTICVLIPVHNQADHLFRALSSVVWQLAPEDEVIVVDDASEDLGTDSQVWRFKDRVLWLHNPVRLGVSGSRNVGIRRSQAEWIKFLDADDVVSPYALDLVRRARPPIRNEIQVVAGGCHRIVDHGYADYLCGTEESLQRIKEINPMLPSAVFVRRRALLEVGLFDERMDFEEDWDLWLRLHERYGVSAFATTTAPVCYYWINNAERQQKRRNATVDGIPVREYFRQRYGAEPAD